MSTFLEIVQMTARESGTVSGTAPSSVMGQSGRLAKFVEWVAIAWTQIQNARSAWRWMRAEFTGTTTSGTARYTRASFSLTRWADWITGDGAISIYKQSEGVSDETVLVPISWDEYRNQYVRGSQTNDRPIHYTVSPAGELCFGPVPDDTYVVRGEYRKSPQTLAANSDIPEMPARFHDLIAWKALLLMSEHDEAPLHIGMAMRRYRELSDDLERDQLPRTHIAAGPLA